MGKDRKKMRITAINLPTAQYFANNMSLGWGLSLCLYLMNTTDLQEERYQQIEYDNRLLLERMSDIMKVGKKTAFYLGKCLALSWFLMLNDFLLYVCMYVCTAS